MSEHQIEQVSCPQCQRVSCASFPSEASAPAQYGPGIRALAVYLHQYQLVSIERTCEALGDLCGCQMAEGTVLSWVAEAAERLEQSVEKIAEWVSVSPVQHADETGVRLAGKGDFLHVNSTRFLTHLAWHARRGSQATIGHRHLAALSWPGNA